MSDWEVDLPLDMLMCALTSFLHVKLGKYELSDLKSFYSDFWGVEGVLHLTWLYNANWLLLLKLFGNEENSHLFLKNSKMAA